MTEISLKNIKTKLTGQYFLNNFFYILTGFFISFPKTVNKI